jgi:hypothetical protein
VGQTNHYYDFSKVTVGGKFDTNIETDLNGDSGFFLKWQVGDILLFKEFGGNNFNDRPNVPLLEYSVKAKILAMNGLLNSLTQLLTIYQTGILQSQILTVLHQKGGFEERDCL